MALPRSGNPIWGLSPVLRRGLAQFLKDTRIDGERPRTAEDIDEIIAFVELRRLREVSFRLWMDEMVAALAAPPAPAEGAVETWIDAQVQRIEHALAWEARDWPRLHGGIVQVLSDLAVPARPSPADLTGSARCSAVSRRAPGSARCRPRSTPWPDT